MEQTQAASSPAEVDVFNGEQPTLAEYQQYRQSGEVPARFKPAEPAESAPADPPKEDDAEPEEAEAAPESDPEETQEQPQKGSAAEKRIKQLLARNKELERQLAAPKQTQSDPSPARPQQPQNYAEYRKTFKPSEWITEYAKANPEASYEDANAAMADHLSDVRDHFRRIEERVNAAKQALDKLQEEARERYEDFDEIKSRVVSRFVTDKGMPNIPPQVYEVIDTSDVLADLLYTIGSDEEELDKFVAMAKASPSKAIRYVAKVESLIAEELAKPKDTPARGNDGKFIAPEKRQTAAPKPPSPVGGGTSRAFDVSDENLSPEEWMRQRNAQIAKRRG